MRKPFLFLVGAVLIMACGGRTKVPKGILPPAKMQEVLWDMVSAGEFLNGYVLNKDSVDRFIESAKVYGQVLQFHHITREDFDKSYLYYSQRPQLMAQILDTLSKRQITPEKIVEKENDPAKEPESITPRRDTIRYIDTAFKRRDSLRTRLLKKISPAKL